MSKKKKVREPKKSTKTKRSTTKSKNIRKPKTEPKQDNQSNIVTNSPELPASTYQRLLKFLGWI